MFGVSFSELLLVAVVALVIVGPARLPGMLNTVGKWSVKLRRMIFDMRAQSGIDEILREEGLLGGLQELRQLRQSVRTEIANLGRAAAQGPQVPPTSTTASSTSSTFSPGSSASTPAFTPAAPASADSGSLLHVEPQLRDPYQNVPYDRSREYPVEGCDAAGALPDDLWESAQAPAVAAAATPESEPVAVEQEPAAAESEPLASEAQTQLLTQDPPGEAAPDVVHPNPSDAARVE